MTRSDHLEQLEKVGETEREQYEDFGIKLRDGELIDSVPFRTVELAMQAKADSN